MNHPLLRHFRAKRMRWVQRELRLTPSTRVLDVGGTLFNWTLAPVVPRLTLLNIGPRPNDLPASVEYVQGDAQRLAGIGDGAYDLVYSNSVIEHLGTFSAQTQMAAEIRRVGRSYFVQTPDPRFPVEPHVMAIGYHWLSRAWQRRVLRWATLWGWLARPSAEQLDARVAELRLVSAREMAQLFPDARVYVERWLGWPKSLVALRRHQSVP